MRLGMVVTRAAVTAALAAGAVVLGRWGGAPAGAQAVPPLRVYGSATIDGSEATPGTLIEATVNGASCGSDRLIGGTYVIDVISAATRAWCAVPGATVSFQIGGVPARESVVYESGAFVRLNLTRATVPPLDPGHERPRIEVVKHDEPMKLDVFAEAGAADVTVLSRYAAGYALAAVYPATPSGTATLYIIAATGAAITSGADPQGRCTGVFGYPNMLVCTVVAGAVVTFEGLGP